MSRRTLFRFTRAAIFPAEGMPLHAQRVTHATDQPPHDHEFAEVALILSGNAVHQSVHGLQPLQPGDVIVMRGGAWHGYRDCHELQVYNCCFGSELFSRELAWTVDDPSLGYLYWSGLLDPQRRGVFLLHLSPAALRRCTRLLDILRHTILRHPGRRAQPIARLLLFLDEVALQAHPRSGHSPRLKHAPSPAVVRTLHLLQANVAYPWTSEYLAELANTDQSYLIRLFKAATGLPPLAYLARLRAERAAGLLVRTDLPVSEIAVKVGWDMPHYFARRFKAHFGLTATEYRFRYAAIPATDGPALPQKI